jgi:plasmid stabilization system protein ParE
MTAEIVIALEAAQDIDEAYGWYEDRRVGLGEEFLSCVDACIQSIRRLPEMHAKVHEEYRRALVRRFPYVVCSMNTLLAPSPCTVFSIPREILASGVNDCRSLW